MPFNVRDERAATALHPIERLDLCASRRNASLRPSDTDRDGAALDLRPDLGRHGRCRQGQGHELRGRNGRRLRSEDAVLTYLLLSGQLAPAVHEVVVDAVRHRHLGHSHPRLVALRHDLRLELRAVASPRLTAAACHRVHLFLRGHDPSQSGLRIQDDLAGRIRLFCQDCHRLEAPR